MTRTSALISPRLACAGALFALLASAPWGIGSLVAQDVPSGTSPARSPLAPDTVMLSLDGPRIVLLATPGEGVVALRLSVPLREGRAEAGAGILLRDLAVDRMRSLARPIGAQVSGVRTPWGLAYTVVGAAADFEYLAYLLREAVAPPGGGAPPAFQEGRERLATLAIEASESPQRRVAAELRGQASPGLLPVEGTPGSVAALDPGSLRSFWARTHQPSSMTLVAAASVAPEVLLAATQGMGAQQGSAAPPVDTPAPAEPRRGVAQTLRTWYGEAWSAPGPLSAEAAVAAILVSRHLQGSRLPGLELSVELWEFPDRWVLAVVGAAYPRDVQAMRRTVSNALSGARAALEPSAVAEAVAQLRRERLLLARTPAGLVSVVGRNLDATGDPRAAVTAAEALDRAGTEGVRSLLDDLLRRPPHTAQVRP